MNKLNKKHLFLGLGTIVAVSAPIATVVSCGSDDKTTTGGSGTQTPTGGSGTTTGGSGTTTTFTHTTFTGIEFFDALEAKAPIFNFLERVKDASSTTNQAADSYDSFIVKPTLTYDSFIVKPTLTVADYETAYKAIYADVDSRKKFDDVLKANKNDPVLATAVIAFTQATIKGFKSAMTGLKDIASFITVLANPVAFTDPDSLVASGVLTAIQAASIKKVTQEIKGGSLDAKSIADGIMSKFSGADPIWNTATINALYTSDGHTLTEVNTLMAATMGGAKLVKLLVEKTGFTYVVKTTP